MVAKMYKVLFLIFLSQEVEIKTSSVKSVMWFRFMRVLSSRLESLADFKVPCAKPVSKA